MQTFQQYVSNTKRNINEISPEMVHHERAKNTVLIDVRESNELQSGKIPGAICISRGILESQLLSIANLNDPESCLKWLEQQTIVLYCRSGARSALAADSLQAMGLSDTYSLAGGITQWQQLGYPIEPVA